MQAITTRQVLREQFPVLSVTHYSDDHSWAFVCGTTGDTSDILVVGMGEMLAMDNSLLTIADLEPGWTARRKVIGGDWTRYQDNFDE